MLTQIEFIINREELIEALKYLSPFVASPKKEDDEYDDEDSEIRLPEPYFYDKVTFLLHKRTSCLFVITKEGVRVGRTCDVNLGANVEEVSFCMPFAYLLQEMVKYSAESCLFKEDRFFGFIVSDTVTGKHLFDIDAHSISKQPTISGNLSTHSLDIETNTLKKVLREFPQYTTDYSYSSSTDYIWFHINDGICRVIACTGSQLRQEVFPTDVKGAYVFSLSGKFASRIFNIVVNWMNQSYLNIGYNDTYLCFLDFKRGGEYWENIEVPLCKTECPSFQNILNKRNVINTSSVHLTDLQTALRIFNTIDYKKEYVLMHFFPDHVNFYCGSAFSENIAVHFIDADSDGEFIIKLKQKELETIIEEIYTENVLFALVDDKLLYINNEDEPLFGDIIRIQGTTTKLQDDDLKILEQGDKSLNSHEGYIEKYLTKHDDEEDTSKEYNETYIEMKEEAVFRMKEIIDYTDIIDYFEETGLPQVYEPPYGASYSLEEDELKKVREIEETRNILVWGIVRCYMMYNGQEVTVDCLLHVSQDKNEWEKEREDLLTGFPFVYTVMKEYPVIDHGHINVYKSRGGTLLRG